VLGPSQLSDGIAEYQLVGQHLADQGCLRQLAGASADQQVGGFPADLFHGLHDAGELGAVEITLVEGVKAGNGDIVGDAVARVPEGLGHAVGVGVVWPL